MFMYRNVVTEMSPDRNGQTENSCSGLEHRVKEHIKHNLQPGDIHVYALPHTFQICVLAVFLEK